MYGTCGSLGCIGTLLTWPFAGVLPLLDACRSVTLCSPRAAPLVSSVSMLAWSPYARPFIALPLGLICSLTQPVSLECVAEAVRFRLGTDVYP